MRSTVKKVAPTAPESQLFCLVFVDLFTEGGLESGSTTPDTAVDESQETMADRVARCLV